MDHIIQKLKNEEVILLPTDTVPGLCCKMSSNKAVQDIYTLKRREFNKPLAIIASDWRMVEKLFFFNRNILRLLTADISITVIAQQRPNLNLPRYLNIKNQTIALRITKDNFLKKLIRKLGEPIAATSANLSGNQPSIAELYREFAEFIPKNYNFTYNFSKTASPIIDCTIWNKAKIIRADQAQRNLLKNLLAK